MSQDFFRPPQRAPRGIPRTTFHLTLSETERDKLVKLSRKLKKTGSEVLRFLLEKAKA